MLITLESDQIRNLNKILNNQPTNKNSRSSSSPVSNISKNTDPVGSSKELNMIREKSSKDSHYPEQQQHHNNNNFESAMNNSNNNNKSETPTKNLTTSEQKSSTLDSKDSNSLYRGDKDSHHQRDHEKTSTLRKSMQSVFSSMMRTKSREKSVEASHKNTPNNTSTTNENHENSADPVSLTSGQQLAYLRGGPISPNQINLNLSTNSNSTQPSINKNLSMKNTLNSQNYSGNISRRTDIRPMKGVSQQQITNANMPGNTDNSLLYPRNSKSSNQTNLNQNPISSLSTSCLVNHNQNSPHPVPPSNTSSKNSISPTPFLSPQHQINNPGLQPNSYMVNNVNGTLPKRRKFGHEESQMHQQNQNLEYDFIKTEMHESHHSHQHMTNLQNHPASLIPGTMHDESSINSNLLNQSSTNLQTQVIPENSTTGNMHETSPTAININNSASTSNNNNNANTSSTPVQKSKKDKWFNFKFLNRKEPKSSSKNNLNQNNSNSVISSNSQIDQTSLNSQNSSAQPQQQLQTKASSQPDKRQAAQNITNVVNNQILSELRTNNTDLNNNNNALNPNQPRQVYPQTNQNQNLPQLQRPSNLNLNSTTNVNNIDLNVSLNHYLPSQHQHPQLHPNQNQNQPHLSSPYYSQSHQQHNVALKSNLDPDDTDSLDPNHVAMMRSKSHAIFKKQNLNQGNSKQVSSHLQQKHSQLRTL